MHTVAAPVIILGVIALIAFYVVRFVAMRQKNRLLQVALSVLSAIAVAGWIVTMAIGIKTSSSSGYYIASIAFTCTYVVIVPLIFITLVSLISKLPRLWKSEPMNWLDKAGLAVGVMILILMIAGCFTRKSLSVSNHEIIDEALPAEFDGLRIAQISDMHLESFGNDTVFISRMVNRINELKPDVIVFTGDIVSRRADELKPFVKPLSRLRAPLGVYAILGNHDYADYVEMTDEERIADRQQLRQLYSMTAFTLLRDSTVYLTSIPDTIALIGTENISTGRHRFNTYGSLRKAYPCIGDNKYKILLTHDPAFWVDSIADKVDANINLTLSGHTHAMQCRVLGWTPASLSFKTPAGLYSTDDGRRLYVNVGIGTVGPLTRVGANPEITLLTLKRNP